MTLILAGSNRTTKFDIIKTVKNRVRLGVVLEKRESRDGVDWSDNNYKAVEDHVSVKSGTRRYPDGASSLLLPLRVDSEIILTVCVLNQVATIDHLVDDSLSFAGSLKLLLGAVDLLLQLGDALLLRLLVGPHVGLPGTVLVELGLGPAPLGTDLEECG